MYLLLLFHIILVLYYLNCYYVLNNVKTFILMLCVFMFLYFYVLNVSFSDCFYLELPEKMVVAAEKDKSGFVYKTYIFEMPNTHKLVVVRRFFASSFLSFDFIYTPVKFSGEDFPILNSPGLREPLHSLYLQFVNDVLLFKKDYVDLHSSDQSNGYYYFTLSSQGLVKKNDSPLLYLVK